MSVLRKSKKREFIIGLIFVVLTTAVTLVLGEVAIRIVCSRKLIYNIEMVKYARELKVRDTRGLVSHVHRPSSQAKLMGVDVTLNSMGNRSPELTDPKPKGYRRILVLGSSVTMGWGVPAESVFTSVMARRLNEARPFGKDVEVEIANAGIGNYNTAFQHRLFLDQYPKIRPDMVVLHYFVSDVQPRTMGRNNPVLKHSFLAAFCLDRISQLQFRQKKTDLFTFYSDLYASDSPAWKATLEHISQMRDRCEADGVPFLVMIVPDIHDLGPTTPFKDLYAKIEAAFRALNLRTVSTFAAFQERFGSDAKRLWIQSDDPHPNASGHALMAELLTERLIREGMPPGRPVQP